MTVNLLPGELKRERSVFGDALGSVKARVVNATFHVVESQVYPEWMPGARAPEPLRDPPTPRYFSGLRYYASIHI